jgi:uncharacterized protein
LTQRRSSPGRRSLSRTIVSRGERRFVTLGLLKGIPVSIVHTENEDEIRVISFRKATPNEAAILFENI